MVGSVALGTVVVFLIGTWREIRARRVVDRYLEAAGGLEALAAIRDRVVIFQRTHVPSGNSYCIQRYSRRGWKLRESWKRRGFVFPGNDILFTLMYDGEQGLVRAGGSVRLLDDHEIPVYLREARLEDFFLRWEDDGFHLEYGDRTSVDGETVDVVAALSPRGERITYFFSPSDGLLVAKEWRHGEEDSWVTKRERYREYRPIPFSDDSDYSVRLPTRVDTHVNGEWESEVRHTDVRINTAFLDEVFSRPRSRS